MMSGYLWWGNGGWDRKGTYGFFWSSTPASYANSRFSNFSSTGISPKNGSSKPYGLALRCVAFQSSPQPSSFGYDVGLLRLAQRQFRLGRQEWLRPLLVLYPLRLHKFALLALLLY